MDKLGSFGWLEERERGIVCLKRIREVVWRRGFGGILLIDERNGATTEVYFNIQDTWILPSCIWKEPDNEYEELTWEDLKNKNKKCSRDMEKEEFMISWLIWSKPETGSIENYIRSWIFNCLDTVNEWRTILLLL